MRKHTESGSSYSQTHELFLVSFPDALLKWLRDRAAHLTKHGKYTTVTQEIVTALEEYKKNKCAETLDTNEKKS